MFSTILGELTGKLDKRFLTNVFFPTMLFSGFLIYLFHLKDASDALDSWNELPSEIQAIYIIVSLFVVTFLSYFLDGQLINFLRLYEGYWEDQLILRRFFPAKKAKYQLEIENIYKDLEALNRRQQILNLHLKAIRLRNKWQSVQNIKELLDGSIRILQDAGSGNGQEIEYKEAIEKLKEAKIEILRQKPELSTAAATRAEEEIEKSIEALNNFKSGLNSLKLKPMIVEHKLMQLNEMVKCLKKDLKRSEDTYQYIYSIILNSQDLLKRIKSAVDCVKSIKEDLIFIEIPSSGCMQFSWPADKKNFDSLLDSAISSFESTKEEINKIASINLLAGESSEDKDEKEIEKNLYGATSESNRIYERAYYYFPPPTRIEETMPTRLGNAMKSAELYSKERYGIDSVFLWPKIYPLLGSDRTTALAESRGSLDLMILISILSFAFSIIGGFILLFSGSQPLQFLVVFWGSLGLGWAAYHGAIAVAIGYGDMIRSTFDLYRDKLISELGLKAPASLKEEKDFWSGLEQWMYRNAPPTPSLSYQQTAASKEAK